MTAGWQYSSLEEMNRLGLLIFCNIFLLEHAMASGIPPLLAGRMSREIKLQMEKLNKEEFRMKKLELFSKFFGVSLITYFLQM